MGRRHGRGRTDRSHPGDLCWLEERGCNPRGISPAVVRFDPPGPWAQSTSGSAPRLQREACRFEPGWVHPCGRGGIGRRAGLRPRWAHTHESSTLSARTRAPLAQLVERWTLNPCRRGFESLGAHSTGFPVASGCSSAWQSTRLGTGGSAVRVRSTRRAVSWHRMLSGVVQRYGRSALDRETVVRSHLPEHR